MNKLISSIRSFAIEDDGAQIVEYSLIIAVVSIALVLLLAALLGTGGAGPFQSFIARVTTCLTSTTGACA